MAHATTPTIEDTWCTVDADYHFTYTTVYKCQMTSAQDGPNTVASHAIIPRYGDSYEVGNDSNSDAFAVGAEVKRIPNDGTRLHWTVTVTHSTKQQNTRNTTTQFTNPLAEPVKISGSFQRGTRIVDRERDGKILMNSSEEPFKLEVPYGHDTLVLEINTATIALLQRAKAMFKTNKLTIWGLPAYALLLTQWNYDILWYGRNPYAKNRLEFEISYDVDKDNNFIGWDRSILDEGFRILFDRSKKDPNDRYVVPMPNDAPLAHPILLDGNGSWLDIAANPDGKWLTKKPIRDYDFHLLTFLPDPLPGPFA